MQQNVEPSAIFFQAFSLVIPSFTGSSSQFFEAPTALSYRCCWVFAELTWNLSIRSKATWAKSFLMVLAYPKQIIKNQRKTVRRVVTINVCWRKSSCELPPLATTHAKRANSSSGKIAIASSLPHPLFFSKKSVAIANATGKLARYSSSLLPICGGWKCVNLGSVVVVYGAITFNMLGLLQPKYRRIFLWTCILPKNLRASTFWVIEIWV